MPLSLLPRCAALVALVLLFAAPPAHAQLGGLIKKKVTQATGTTPSAEPVKFDDLILEITPDRVTNLLAAKRAAKQFADGPNGPSAITARIESLDARQAAIYDKQVNAINGWDEKRRDHERCLDSAFSELGDQARERTPDPQSMQKVMQLGQAMAAAQQKGDTAEARRILQAMNKTKEPTKADSLAAAKQCGLEPVPPALVKQWLDLKSQIDALSPQLQASQDTLRATETRLSGMTPRQNGMFCERIKAYIQQLKQKQKHVGFSDKELQTLANLDQAIKDLEALCP